MEGKVRFGSLGQEGRGGCQLGWAEAKVSDMPYPTFLARLTNLRLGPAYIQYSTVTSMGLLLPGTVSYLTTIASHP